MISFIRKVYDRGFILSAEIMFNRIVPAWLFRCSVGVVFELDLPRMCDSWKALRSDDFLVACVTDAQARAELRKLTYNSVPSESSENDFGYAISKTGNSERGNSERGNSERGNSERALGGVWAARESFIETDLGFQIMLRDDQAWLYCAYVDAKTRSRGVYKRVLSYAGYDLTERGFDRLLVITQPWNKHSIHVHQKFAKKKLGRVAALRLGRMSFVFCSGAISKNRTLTTQQLSDPILLRIDWTASRSRVFTDRPTR